MELTEEFKEILSHLNDTNQSAFISGKAGVGKSTLMKHFIETTNKQVVVLAPTGIAALNVEGQTIHSFFKLPPKLIDSVKLINVTKDLKELLKHVDTIIVDEVSMVRADLINAIDYSLKKHTGKKEPFGGKQMVFVGDLYQLPPVVTRDDAYFFKDSAPYFFNSGVFSNGKFSVRMFQLSKVFRQKDQGFKEILNRIRIAEHSSTDINTINTRVNASYEPDEEITLTAINKTANNINFNRLKSLETPMKTFDAKVDGEFDKGSFPTEQKLWLKMGAKVMMVNNDTENRWVNGSIGTIIDFTKDGIKVKIDDLTHTVTPYQWQKIEYMYNEAKQKMDKEIIGSFEQYPMKLGWAITIHKSQGKTFDKVFIDLGFGAFAHGQTYVALSRCTTMEGITLKKPLKNKDIIVDDEVNEFMNSQQLNLF